MPNAQNIFLISITPTVELNSYVSRCSRSRWTFEKIFVNKQHSRQTWSVRVENSFKMFITLRFWVQFISFYACLKERCPNLLIWLFKFIWINARLCRAIAANPKYDSRKANVGGLRSYLVKSSQKLKKGVSIKNTASSIHPTYQESSTKNLKEIYFVPKIHWSFLTRTAS